METDISWKCALENRADLCVSEGQALSEYRVSLAEEEEEEEEGGGEKSIFDRVWFSRKMTVLDSVAKYPSSISHVDNDGEAYKT